MKNPGAFNKIISAKYFVDNFGEVKGEKNKRIPKEFMESAVGQPLLFNKNFYFGAKLDTEFLLKESLADEIFGLYLAGKPFNAFFKKAIQ